MSADVARSGVTRAADAGATRADRRRERTRRRLLEAGRVLIAERGVAGLRIQEITERADVALGSFYNHFPTKDDLVEAVVGESMATLAAATIEKAAPDADPAEIVVTASLAIIRLAVVEPGFARLVSNLSRADLVFATSMYPFAREVLERGVARGRFRVADMEVALTAIVGGAFALIREILEGRHEPGAEQAFAQFVLASLGICWDEAVSITAAQVAAVDGVDGASAVDVEA